MLNNNITVEELLRACLEPEEADAPGPPAVTPECPSFRQMDAKPILDSSWTPIAASEWEKGPKLWVDVRLIALAPLAIPKRPSPVIPAPTGLRHSNWCRACKSHTCGTRRNLRAKFWMV